MQSILTMVYGQLLRRFHHQHAAVYDETSTNAGLHPVVSDDGFQALLREIDYFSKSFNEEKQVDLHE